jgi:hypothetical protein
MSSSFNAATVAEVERKIADLNALRDELADLIGRCCRGTVAEGRIIETVVPRGALGSARRSGVYRRPRGRPEGRRPPTNSLQNGVRLIPTIISLTSNHHGLVVPIFEGRPSVHGCRRQKSAFG